MHLAPALLVTINCYSYLFYFVIPLDILTQFLLLFQFDPLKYSEINRQLRLEFIQQSIMLVIMLV